MDEFKTGDWRKFRRMKKAFGLICVNLWFIFLFATSIFAQTISGTVSDGRGAPIENAQVTLTAQTAQTKIISQTKTDAEGRFSISPNDAQNAILLIKAAGFAAFSEVLPTSADAPLTIVLKPLSPNEEVTVSITKTESRLSETPASIVVLNHQTLSTTAALTIDDALRQVAGFTLFRRGSSKTTNPTAQGANLRGIGGSGASRTAVLFDGISLNDAFGGWTYWSRVPKIAVEEAEILRGGASSIYGSAALSGAINLQTRQADAPILSFETSGGLQNTFDASLFTSFGARGWKFDFAAEHFQTAGYIPVAKPARGAVDTPANSRYNNGFLTVERKFENRLRIFGRGNLFGERRANGTILTNNRTYFRQAVFGADFEHKTFGAFQLRASIERQIYDQTFSAIAANRNVENLTRIQRVPSQAASADLFWSKVFASHVVSASAETKIVRGFSDENIIVSSRAAALASAGGNQRTAALFAQDFWRASRKLNINFGARFDVWNNYDARSTNKNLTTGAAVTTIFPNRNEKSFSPRIGAIYQIDNNFSVFAAYTNSFRAPTLNELYRAFRVGNILTLANENLRAEHADTFESGANFTAFINRLSVRANVFLTTVSNPVVSISLSATPALITRQRQNVGQTRSSGVELDAEFSPLPKLKFSSSYLLVNSRIEKFPANPNLVGRFLPQIPRQQLTFQTFYRPRTKISLSLQGRISAAQFEDDLNTLRLRPYFVLDGFAAYQISKGLKIFAAAENIFDNRYDIGLTPNRTIAAPRFVRLGVNLNFGKK